MYFRTLLTLLPAVNGFVRFLLRCYSWSYFPCTPTFVEGPLWERVLSPSAPVPDVPDADVPDACPGCLSFPTFPTAFLPAVLSYPGMPVLSFPFRPLSSMPVLSYLPAVLSYPGMPVLSFPPPA